MGRIDENADLELQNEKRANYKALWHMAFFSRIEDITMNILVAGSEQVFNVEDLKEK